MNLVLRAILKTWRWPGDEVVKKLNADDRFLKSVWVYRYFEPVVESTYTVRVIERFLSDTHPHDFFISNARLKFAKKTKQNLSNNLRLNFSYLRIIGFLHPRYHPKIIGNILKNIQKQSLLFKRGYMINDNENWNWGWEWKIDHIDSM